MASAIDLAPFALDSLKFPRRRYPSRKCDGLLQILGDLLKAGQLAHLLKGCWGVLGLLRRGRILRTLGFGLEPCNSEHLPDQDCLHVRSFGQRLNAKTHSMMKFSTGIKLRKLQAPEYPALLMIRHTGTMYVEKTKRMISQCQMLIEPMVSPRYCSCG